MYKSIDLVKLGAVDLTGWALKEELKLDLNIENTGNTKITYKILTGDPNFNGPFIIQEAPNLASGTYDKLHSIYIKDLTFPNNNYNLTILAMFEDSSSANDIRYSKLTIKTGTASVTSVYPWMTWSSVSPLVGTSVSLSKRIYYTVNVKDNIEVNQIVFKIDGRTHKTVYATSKTYSYSSSFTFGSGSASTSDRYL